MDNYVKLYQRILDSSIWKQPSDVRIVWITMLALKDEDGCVYGSEGWLADRARVTDEVCHKALEMFKSPDARSRTVTNDGRKIEVVEGGWRILNHLLYRDGIEDQREKWRRQKANQRQKKGKPVMGLSGKPLVFRKGESIHEVIKRDVDECPITKADKAEVAVLPEKGTVLDGGEVLSQSPGKTLCEVFAEEDQRIREERAGEISLEPRDESGAG